MKIKPGDKVTCLYTEPAYYSGYAGNPVVLFEPGMVGVVASIAPKVFIIPKDRRSDQDDGLADFVVVDFTIEGKPYRTGLCFCNVRLLKNGGDK